MSAEINDIDDVDDFGGVGLAAFEPEDDEEGDDSDFGRPVPLGAQAWQKYVHGATRENIALDLDLSRAELDEMLAAHAAARLRQGSVTERLAVVESLLDSATEWAYSSLDRGPSWADPGPMLSALTTVAKLRLEIIHSTTDARGKKNG